MAVAVVLGSAFGAPVLDDEPLRASAHQTEFGAVELFRLKGRDDAWVCFRHGAPHRLLPSQIPYRAQAAALSAVGVRSVLLQSSVGVLTEALPLFEPLLASDLLMLENRLPDGTAATMFTTPKPGQGHLILEEGAFSSRLSEQVSSLAAEAGHPVRGRAVFAYAQGPRTKTPAENRALAAMGGEVNSMTVGPEAVLLGELGVSVAALLVGHKYSLAVRRDDVDHETIEASLRKAHDATVAIVTAFLRDGEPVASGNRVHRLG